MGCFAGRGLKYGDKMNILNFGSMNIDYVYSVEHLVLPGETIHASKMETFCGGKGLNQSIALARAGAHVFHAGLVGYQGQQLIDLLQINGVNCSLIHQLPMQSGHTIIQVDASGQNSIILFGGANRAVDQHYVDEVLRHFQAGDVLVLQNEISSLAYLFSAAHEKRLRIVFNPSPFEEGLLQLPLEYVDYFLVNEVEGYQFSGSDEPDQILQRLYDRYHANVVLTLGADGAMFYDGKEKLYHPAFPAKAVDTTGAGDTFTGYFLYAVFSGHHPNIALRMASKAASIAITKPGAAASIPFMMEVSKQMESEQ